MTSALAPVAEIYALDTTLLANCFTGVSDAQAATRVLVGTNSMAFVAAHVIDARFYAATLLGRTVPNPLEATLGAVERIEDVTSMPPAAELLEMWTSISNVLAGALESASAERLEAPSPRRFPVRDGSVLGALTFLAQHESYHVGQLALLRKALGHSPMSYARPAETGP
jgi:uncharacterized damage-inducible protein DinB